LSHVQRFPRNLRWSFAFLLLLGAILMPVSAEALSPPPSTPASIEGPAMPVFLTPQQPAVFKATFSDALPYANTFCVKINAKAPVIVQFYDGTAKTAITPELPVCTSDPSVINYLRAGGRQAGFILMAPSGAVTVLNVGAFAG
jgi:hypothetical protein